ncbi:CPBP family intramembrane glutamic endopeptidase [Ornithinibacillus xuwenensis]|uniref:CPBP family intramembrane glutamic endopeptidase n=1 Tax=Ornithinibacillus xuwenensis TaxID=3144668 RepID=A0ABU9XK22_9BACI
MEPRVNKNYIWLYFLSFYSLWCIRELWFVQYIDLMDSVLNAIISAIIKIIIWILPVILIVRTVEKQNVLSYLGLRDHYKKGLIWTVWGTTALILYFFILNLIVLENDIGFNLSINELLNTVLLVGITEEIVFRGFLLRKLMDSNSFWQANILTSLLFVSIHFPIWIYKGLFELPYILASMATAFVLGIIFGFIYRKSNSLWSVIILHSLYNFLVSIYY